MTVGAQARETMTPTRSAGCIGGALVVGAKGDRTKTGEGDGESEREAEHKGRQAELANELAIVAGGFHGGGLGEEHAVEGEEDELAGEDDQPWRRCSGRGSPGATLAVLSMRMSKRWVMVVRITK